MSFNANLRPKYTWHNYILFSFDCYELWMLNSLLALQFLIYANSTPLLTAFIIF